MARNRILIPRGTLSQEEMDRMATSLFRIGYAVVKRSIRSGENKGSKYIEYWLEKEQEDVRACNTAGGEG